ncbi:MAG: zinc carboxypeptidase, partial [bacterium]|nr:zinc carboxypeptidase [bacterium]
MKTTLFACVVALVLAVPVFGQGLNHYRLETIANGPELAQQLEQAGFTVVEGGILPASIELHLTPAERAVLEGAGYELLLISIGRPYQQIQQEIFDASPEAVPAGYPTLAEIIASLNATEAAYPNIAQVINLTTTYNAPLTHDGNEMFAIKISNNVGTEEDEPSMFVMANQHSNEIGTAIVALKAIEELTTKYATDSSIRAIVDANEIFIAPVWNPDGLDYVHFVNNNWRKNRRPNGGSSFGVDLNRNFSAGWSASCSGSTNPNSGNYKGPAPLSEPESETMQLFAGDQRFAKVLEYHSSGRETLWEFNCTNHPWASFMQDTAILLSQNSGYGSANRAPSAEGEHYEWEFTNGAVSHLIEIGTSQQPSFASAEAEAAQLFPGIQWFLEEPYRL